MVKSISDICSEYIAIKQKTLRESTLCSYRSALKMVSNYLSDKGIVSLSEITKDTITGFTLTLTGYSSASANMLLSKFSGLLKHAYEQGYIVNDVARYCLKVICYKDSKIPDVFSVEEINRAIAVIDTTTAIGKRNYAILMVSSRLGLRGSDIINLKFRNLRFDTDTIEISQSKTEKRLALPMSDEVGMALINYLREGRPKSDSGFIFLQHKPPYPPLKHFIKSIVANYHARSAGFETGDTRTLGVRSLRHSLASAMLANNTSIYKIKDFLGHESIDTTMRYIKIDQPSLCQCALEVPPVFTEKEA